VRENDYPANVGDIAFDPAVDDDAFTLCDENMVRQYYNFGKGLQYKGEKAAIDDHFNGKVSGDPWDNGFLTIRFIVNCKGQTGRFRVEGMGNDYEVKEFSEGLTNELLSLTRSMDGWIVAHFDGARLDYYQYLTFKLEEGRLIEIMP
jgi:hypothetical protein